MASFTATPSGCASVAAGGTCTISVVFTATAGAKSATVVINHNSNNVPGTVTNVALTGTGVAAVAAPRVTMPATLNFGRQRINQNRTQTLTVTNQGPGALLITTVTTSGGVFTATRGNCPTSLAAGRNCKLNVTFRPLVAGQTYVGTVTVNSNASNSPTSSALTGIREMTSSHQELTDGGGGVQFRPHRVRTNGRNIGSVPPRRARAVSKECPVRPPDR